MGVGIIMAGAGIAALGVVEEYWLMFACASVSGVGVALFHPEGGKLANYVADEKKGAGISNFSVGGNLGFAIGPVIALFALGMWGMHGTLVFLVPTVVMGVVILSQTRRYIGFGHQEAERRSAAGQGTQHDDWPGFAKVTVVNFLRSIVGSGLIVFIPLYWIGVLEVPTEVGSLMLTLYSGAGAVATFFGGRLADRIGFKRMIVLSFCLLGPLLLAFVLSRNLVLAGAFMMLASLALSAAYGPMIALGQSYLPNRLGLASGISLGVVVSVGGISSPVIGAVGDAWGLVASLSVICALAFAGGLSSFLLVRHKGKTGS
jgi:FSR family fosmidomycin resistance protein-like MFS transporter